MSSAFIAKLRNGSLSFGSLLNRARFQDFCVRNAGRAVRIELVSGKTSDAQRGYYFGAVLPLVRQLVPQWEHTSDIEIHAILKRNFGPKFTAFDPITKQNVQLEVSVASNDKSNHLRMETFISAVLEWIRENYPHAYIPLPEEYAAERDSAPLRSPLAPVRREKVKL